ncbi:LysR family transcriptional regulator [Streptomyces ossamyceticus]|uniref:LysR family transcriptional regulator n=1 Tax=Streptomyces ossamyceticus TaxID=249581 RepID=UPI00341514BF
MAEELHFGRAADRLRLSTSRVSNLLRTVERRAGARLFERGNRVVRLTPQGAQLHAGPRAAYVQIERTLEDVRRTGSLGGGVLRAGFSTTLPEKLRAELIDAFERRLRHCRVAASGAAGSPPPALPGRRLRRCRVAASGMPTTDPAQLPRPPRQG